MRMHGWMAGALLAGLFLYSQAGASPTGQKNSSGVTEYRYYGPKKKKKVVKAEETAPALSRAEGQATPAAHPTTNTYNEGATAKAPTYTQTHVPGETPQVATAPRTYTQTHSPGPNSGKAANGQWTPGGASILTTGPIFYSFPFQGGYGPITLAPIVGAGNGYYYNPYAANPGGGCCPPPQCPQQNCQPGQPNCPQNQPAPPAPHGPIHQEIHIPQAAAGR